MSDVLTAQERIAARHILQVTMERCRVLRNAMDPNHGMLAVRREALADDLELMIAPLAAMQSAPTITRNLLTSEERS